MKITFLVLATAIVGGCIAAPSHATERVFPATMPAGLLDKYGTESTHAGRFTAHLAPNATSDPMPASCAAFRDRVEYSADACTVAANASDMGRPARAWGIQAVWAAQGVSGGARIVIAYDAAGAPIAWWDGVRATQGAWYLTE